MRNRMKSFFRFVIIMAVIFAVSIVLAPILYRFLPYKFERIFNRLIMIFSLLAVALFVRVRRETFRGLGLARVEGSGRGFLWGFLWGLMILSMVVILRLVNGHAVWVPKELGVPGWLAASAEVMVSALVIGFIEEIFFRGFLYQTLRDRFRWGLAGALAGTNIFYSLLHFISDKKPFIADPPGWQDSVKLLAAPFASLSSWESIWPGAVGLLLFGLILNGLYIKSGSLYPSIGFHAGCVFFTKMDGLMIDYQNYDTLFWGTSKAYDGILGWMLLVVVGIVFILRIRPLAAGKAVLAMCLIFFTAFFSSSAVPSASAASPLSPPTTDDESGDLDFRPAYPLRPEPSPSPSAEAIKSEPVPTLIPRPTLIPTPLPSPKPAAIYHAPDGSGTSSAAGTSGMLSEKRDIKEMFASRDENSRALKSGSSRYPVPAPTEAISEVRKPEVPRMPPAKKTFALTPEEKESVAVENGAPDLFSGLPEIIERKPEETTRRYELPPTKTAARPVPRVTEAEEAVKAPLLMPTPAVQEETEETETVQESILPHFSRQSLSDMEGMEKPLTVQSLREKTAQEAAEDSRTKIPAFSATENVSGPESSSVKEPQAGESSFLQILDQAAAGVLYEDRDPLSGKWKDDRFSFAELGPPADIRITTVQTAEGTFEGILLNPVPEARRFLRFTQVRPGSKLRLRYLIEPDHPDPERVQAVYVRIRAGRHEVDRVRLADNGIPGQVDVPLGVLAFLKRPFILTLEVTGSHFDSGRFLIDPQVIG